MGAETNAFEPRAVPAPFFIFELAARFEPAALLSTPLARLRAQSLGDEDSFQQIEEALDDQGQR